MSILEAQLQELRDRYGAVKTTVLRSGAVLIEIASHLLPAGWNKERSSIRFLAPQGFPHAAPDCFWTDGDLALQGDREPQNSSVSNPIPEDGGTGRWFSWHLTSAWNPNRDTLSTWVNSINDRLKRLT